MGCNAGNGLAVNFIVFKTLIGAFQIVVVRTGLGLDLVAEELL